MLGVSAPPDYMEMYELFTNSGNSIMRELCNPLAPIRRELLGQQKRLRKKC